SGTRFLFLRRQSSRPHSRSTRRALPGLAQTVRRAVEPRRATTIRGHAPMADVRKVIISCAVTGSLHTPTMSPHLPDRPGEIAEAAIGAARAGAAIVHLHARVADDGRPTQHPDAFRAFLPTIKAATDVVINITTGGAAMMSVEERLQPALTLKPEVASLNM